MRNPPFNPLAYVRKLEEAGVGRQQAEIHAEAFQLFEITQEAVIREDLVTKSDLTHALDKAVAQLRLEDERTRAELQQEISGVKGELQQEIHVVKNELQKEIHGVKTELIKRIVGLILGQTTLFFAALGYLVTWLGKQPTP